MTEDQMQKLMDEVYDKWNEKENKNKSQMEVLKEFSQKHRIAVMLGNFNNQVNNGGINQWWSNMYGPDHHQELFAFLLEAYEKHQDLEPMIRIISIIQETLDKEEFNCECEGLDSNCGLCEGEGTVEINENSLRDINFPEEVDTIFYETKWLPIFSRILDDVTDGCQCQCPCNHEHSCPPEECKCTGSAGRSVPL